MESIWSSMKVISHRDLTGPHVCCGTRILMQPSLNLLWSSNRPATHQQSVWRYRRGQLTSYRFHPMTSCCDIHNPHQLSWNQSRRKIDVATEILIVLKVQDRLQPGWGVRFFSMFLSLLLPVCLMLLFLSSFLLSFEKCTDICISEQSHTSNYFSVVWIIFESLRNCSVLYNIVPVLIYGEYRFLNVRAVRVTARLISPSQMCVHQFCSHPRPEAHFWDWLIRSVISSINLWVILLL